MRWLPADRASRNRPATARAPRLTWSRSRIGAAMTVACAMGSMRLVVFGSIEQRMQAMGWLIRHIKPVGLHRCKPPFVPARSTTSA